MATVCAFLKINDGVGILGVAKEGFPPERRIFDEAKESAWVVSNVEVVGDWIRVSEATERESIGYLALSVKNVSESFLGADAAEFGAGWILSIVM